MRFVSHIRGMQVIIVPTAVRYSNYGDRIVDREGYIAKFTQDEVTDRDVEFIEREFGNVPGRTTELDEVTLSPMLSRVSVFDTDDRALSEHWTPEFKDLVERKLEARAQDHPDFRLMAELPVEAPWPAYMSFDGTLAELVDKVVADGYDPARVLAYERQLPNPRPMVIDALEQKVAEQTEIARTTETVSA